MTAPFSPTMPPLPADHAGGLQVLSRLRRNGFAAFPARCFHEPVVTLRALGRPVTLVSGAEAIRTVLLTESSKFQRLSMGKRILSPIVGDGILVSTGETWRQHRRAMAPAFTPRAVNLMVPHIHSCCAATLDRIGDGGVTDIFQLMQELALDVAAATMFSMVSLSSGARLREMVSTYMTGLGRPRPSDFLLPSWLPTPIDRQRRKFRNEWLTLIEGIVAERPTSDGPQEARDLFDLLQLSFGTSGAKPDRIVIDEATTMMVAGHETTAVALFWTMWLLSRAPDWQEAVAEEVRHVSLAAENASAALDLLPVTKAVVQETLRLFPPAFMTGRETMEGATLAGKTFPAGGIVLIPFWMLHRTPELWPNPNGFDPSRFMQDQEPERFSFLPFGTGPHVCIGAQLAMTEAILAVAMFIQRFQITVEDQDPVLPVGVLSTRPSRAPLFRLHPRQRATHHDIT